jgi:hypothetical protein
MIDNRVLGAVAIAFAGVLFGFATGRLSAWLVPPSGPASVSATAKPSVPLVPTTVPKQADRPSKPPDSTSSIVVLDGPKATDPGNVQKAASPAEPKPTAAPDTARLAPDVTSRALSPGESQGGPARPDARVINQGSADRPEQEDQPNRSTRVSDGREGDLRMLTASPDAYEACRRKYRSFDPSDGTYKPYGQDTRIPCPHLAR